MLWLHVTDARSIVMILNSLQSRFYSVLCCSIVTCGKGNGEVAPLCAMKAFEGSRATSLLIPNLGNRQR